MDNKYQQWLRSLEEKLGLASSQGFNQSIYRVPRRGTQQQHQQENDPYTPRIVSIGPLHHGKRDFMFNEEAKLKEMRRLLDRTSRPNEALKKCAKAIKNIEADARRCYATDLELEEFEMAEILLVDGCFVLENFISYLEIYDKEKPGDVAEFILDLQHDLALLENQIPFFVLETLSEEINYTGKDGPLTYDVKFYALAGFSLSSNLSKKAVRQILEGAPHEWSISHMLDMLHDIYRNTVHDDYRVTETAPAIRVVSEEEESSTTQVQKQQGFQQTARGLHLAGIQLVKGDSEQSLGMYFDNGDGILTIPCLYIDRRTFVIFNNLIAYEQLSGMTSVPVSSYAVLLNSLIKTSHDVELLKQEGIIVQTPGETLDVLSFVRDLAREVTFEYSSFQLAPLCERVNEHIIAAKSPITKGLAGPNDAHGRRRLVTDQPQELRRSIRPRLVPKALLDYMA